MSMEELSLKNKVSVTEAHPINILRYFCRYTTIRGVGRIFIASPVWKYIWTVSIFVMFGVAITNAGFLLRKYIYDRYILQEENLFTTSKQFPDITICNIHPLTTENIANIKSLNSPLFNLVPRVYAEIVRNETLQLHHENATELSVVFERLRSMTGYFSQIPWFYKKNMGHESLILPNTCMLHVKGKLYLRKQPCSAPKLFISSKFFNCWTIQPQSVVQSANEDVVQSLEMMLYFEPNDADCNQCLLEDGKTLSRGALLKLHPYQQYPDDLEEDMIWTAPFIHQEIVIHTIQHEYKTNCLQNGNQIEIIMGNKIVNYSYSHTLANDVHLQNQINLECNCSAAELPQEWSPHFSLPFCETIESEIPWSQTALWRTITRVNCQDNMKIYIENQSEDSQTDGSRQKLCKFLEYETKQQQTILPPHHFHYFLKATQNKRYNQSREASPNATSVSLVKIKMSSKVKLISEKEIYGLSSFLTEIGSNFAMYAGLTLICIVEFAELIYLLIKKTLSKKSFNLKLPTFTKPKGQWSLKEVCSLKLPSKLTTNVTVLYKTNNNMI